MTCSIQGELLPCSGQSPPVSMDLPDIVPENRQSSGAVHGAARTSLRGANEHEVGGANRCEVYSWLN
jgi:hypothetical protein